MSPMHDSLDTAALLRFPAYGRGNTAAESLDARAFVVDLGHLALENALLVMRGLVEKRSRGEIGDRLLLVEHPPVYTLGRGLQRSVREQQTQSPESLQSLRDRLPHPVVEIERGGGVTFHDEGQIIGYPIIRLAPEAGLGLHGYLRKLEAVLCEVVEIVTPALTPSTRPDATGIWVGEKKIASLGIAVRKWVTYHGFALNLATNLSAFGHVRPCGFDAQVMANWSDVAGRELSKDDVLPVLKQVFSKRFSLENS